MKSDVKITKYEDPQNKNREIFVIENPPDSNLSEAASVHYDDVNSLFKASFCNKIFNKFLSLVNFEIYGNSESGRKYYLIYEKDKKWKGQLLGRKTPIWSSSLKIRHINRNNYEAKIITQLISNYQRITKNQNINNYQIYIIKQKDLATYNILSEKQLLNPENEN